MKTENGNGQTYLSPDLAPPPPADKDVEKTFSRLIAQTAAEVVTFALSQLRDFTEKHLAGPSYVADIRIPANVLNLQTFDAEAYVDAAPDNLKTEALEQYGMEFFFSHLFAFDHNGQAERLVLITQDGGQTVTPCTFNAFRDSVVNLTFPPPEAAIDAAAAFYRDCYKDAEKSGRKIVLTFKETLTGEDAAGAPPIVGSIVLAFFPPFYDVSKAMVNPADFPPYRAETGPDGGPMLAIPARPEAFGRIPTPPADHSDAPAPDSNATQPDAEDAGAEGQAEDGQEDAPEVDFPKTPDPAFWDGLLSLTDRYFKILAALAIDGRTLADIPEKRRAALWENLLREAARQFSGKGSRGNRHAATVTPGQADTKPAVRPRFSPDKRLFGLNAATLGALDPQGLLPGMADFFADLRGARLPVKAEGTGGFALSVPELDVFSAVQKAVSGAGFADAPLVFKNGFQDLAHLCGVPAQGKAFRELVKAFFSLSFKPVFLKYEHPSRNVHFIFTGTCWQIIAGFEDLTPEQKDTLDRAIRNGGEIPARILGRKHAVIFKPALPFYAGNRNHYYYEPAGADETLRQLHGAKKRTVYEHYFRQHVLMEYQTMRERHFYKGRPANWTTPPFPLRWLCEERLHMADMFKQRRPGRAFAMVRSIADNLKRAHFLTAFDFSNPDAATYTVNHAHLSETWEKNAKREPAPDATQPATAPAATGQDATQPQTARPKATEKAKPRPPSRPVSPEEQKDGAALLEELRAILHTDLVEALAAKGRPPKDSTLTEEHVREVFRHIVHPFTFHNGGFEIQLSEDWLKDTLRFICKNIVKRSKPITSLSAYLLKRAVPREMSRMEDRIAENCKTFRGRYLEPGAPQYNPDMHAGIIRRVKAAAHMIGMTLPSEY